jgi:alpha-glucosidase
MPWRDELGGGFTAQGVAPWLPIGDFGSHNVESQRREESSLLNLTRELIALRRATPDLQLGDYSRLPAPPGTWAWRRGEATAILLNLSGNDAICRELNGRIVLGTDLGRAGELVSGRLDLRPWEGAILTQASGSL